MTRTSVDIAAITSGIESAVSKLRQEIDAVRNAAKDGIEVGIDTSAAESRIKALTDALDAAKAQVESTLSLNVDADTATRAVMDFANAAEGAEQAISGISQQHLTLDTSQATRALESLRVASERALPPATNSTPTRSRREMEDAKALEQQLERVRRTKEFLERTHGRSVTDHEAQRFDEVFRTKASHNAMLRGFSSVGEWHDGVGARFGSGNAAEAHRRRIMEDINGDVFGPSGRGGAWRSLAGRFAGAAGGVAAGAMTGGGGLWGNIGAGIGGLAGLVPGLGLALGPLLGGALGGLGRGIDQGTQDATATGMDVSNLKHSLGDGAVAFDKLRDKVEGAAEGLGIAYTESARFAKHYAQLTNLTRGDAVSIGGELRTGYGMARGFGMDPGAMIGFMGQMRLTGQFSDEKGAKLLGIQVADAVERGGNRSKMDEVLSAISNFSQTAAHISLSRPDVASYASMMATGTALKLPGLDPAGAAAILGGADSSMRNGGGFGEASKIAIMAAIANSNGNMNVFDVEAQMSGGLFGTSANTFGRDSMLYKWADNTGNAAMKKRFDTLSGSGNAGLTNAKMIFGQLQQQSIDPMEYLASVKGAFGLQSLQQAAALDTMHKADPGLGALQARLKKAGVAPDSIKASSLGGLAEVANGDRQTLDSYSEKLRAGTEYKALSAKERKELDGAGSTEETRNVLLKLLSDRERQETIGDKALNIQTDMRNAFQRMAEGLLPATITIKDGILALVEKLAPESHMLKVQKDKEAGESAVAKGATNRIAMAGNRKALDSLYDRRDAATTDQERMLLDAQIARVEQMTGTHGQRSKPAGGGKSFNLSEWTGKGKGGKGGLTNEQEASLASLDRELGLPPGTIKAQWTVESGLNGGAVSPAGARGFAQFMPSTRATWEKREGRKFTPGVFEDERELSRLQWKENLKQHGGDIGAALRQYNAGDKSRWNNPETNAYVPKIESALGQRLDGVMSEKAPETGGPKGGAGQNATVTGNVRVVIDANGKETTTWAPLRGSWGSGRAVAAGAGGW